MSGETQADYFEHLEVLRRKIIYCLVFLVLGFGVAFAFIEPILELLQAPLQGLDMKLHYFKPYEKFLTTMKIAFFAGLSATIPFAMILLGSFIYPALRKQERIWFFIFIFLVPIIFFGGILFAYWMVLPSAFYFFLHFAGTESVVPILGLGDYFDFVVAILFTFGIVFEFPLGLLLLIQMGVLSVSGLSKARRYIIVLIAIIAAFLTPPDVISQIMLGIPLYLLFELTLFIGWLIEGKNRRSE